MSKEKEMEEEYTFVSGKVYPPLLYVGYWGDSWAIVMDEWHNLYYEEIPREFVQYGDITLRSAITPIDELPEEIRAAIEKEYENEPFPD